MNRQRGHTIELIRSMNTIDKARWKIILIIIVDNTQLQEFHHALFRYDSIKLRQADKTQMCMCVYVFVCQFSEWHTRLWGLPGNDSGYNLQIDFIYLREKIWPKEKERQAKMTKGRPPRVKRETYSSHWQRYTTSKARGRKRRRRKETVELMMMPMVPPQEGERGNPARVYSVHYSIVPHELTLNTHTHSEQEDTLLAHTQSWLGTIWRLCETWICEWETVPKNRIIRKEAGCQETLSLSRNTTRTLRHNERDWYKD